MSAAEADTSARVIEWVSRVDDETRALMARAGVVVEADGLTRHDAFVAVSGGVMGALLNHAWRHRAPDVTIDQLADHLRSGMVEVLTIIAASESEEPAPPERSDAHG